MIRASVVALALASAAVPAAAQVSQAQTPLPQATSLPHALPPIPAHWVLPPTPAAPQSEDSASSAGFEQQFGDQRGEVRVSTPAPGADLAAAGRAR